MQGLTIKALSLYHRFVSPLLGVHCRFHPSCSRYAGEAVAKHGTLKGLWLALKRLCRCTRFSPAAWIPSPEGPLWTHCDSS